MADESKLFIKLVWVVMQITRTSYQYIQGTDVNLVLLVTFMLQYIIEKA